MHNAITKTEEKFMLTSTTISRPLARGIEPKTRAFLRRLALEGTPDLDQQTVEEARHGNRVVHIKVLSLGMTKWEIPIYGKFRPNKLAAARISS
jgi:hypothetical protein